MKILKRLFVYHLCFGMLACATVYKTGSSSGYAHSQGFDHNAELSKELAELKYPMSTGLSISKPEIKEKEFLAWLRANKTKFNSVLAAMDSNYQIYTYIHSIEGVKSEVLKKYCDEVKEQVNNGFRKEGFPVNRFGTLCRGWKETIANIDARNILNNRITFQVRSPDNSFESRAFEIETNVLEALGKNENVSVVIEGHVEVTGSLDAIGPDELKLVYGCTASIDGSNSIRYESEVIDLTVKKKDFALNTINVSKEISTIKCSMRVYDEDGFSRSEKETLIEFTNGMDGFVKNLKNPSKGLEYFKTEIAPWIIGVPLFLKLFDLIDPNDSGDMTSIELGKSRGFTPTIYQVSEPDRNVKPIRLWFTVNIEHTNFDNPAK
ncbi:hypothetical protein DLM76_20405 [Leptospira yasudae]|uniref:hypothetical protein n=1 Tax=Leptospira yasudae TaxID=2202201 RepID=UPI000E59FDBD|nr:hypothetical protein [Leptospira yasudae]RHX90229.1 hypothetical protein DLM76_20405 [Leptospira yasudae]